jgi:hypothetical protein
MSKITLYYAAALLAVGLAAGEARAQFWTYVPYGTGGAFIQHIGTATWTGDGTIIGDSNDGNSQPPIVADTANFTWNINGLPLGTPAPVQAEEPFNNGNGTTYADVWNKHYDTTALSDPNYINGGWAPGATSLTIQPGHTGNLQVIDLAFNNPGVLQVQCPSDGMVVGNLTFNGTGTMVVNSNNAWPMGWGPGWGNLYLAGGITVNNAENVTVAGVSDWLLTAGRMPGVTPTYTIPPRTYTVANASSVLNIGNPGNLEQNYIGPATFVGPGTVNTYSNYGASSGDDVTNAGLSAVTADSMTFTTDANGKSTTVNVYNTYAYYASAVTGTGGNLNFYGGGARLQNFSATGLQMTLNNSAALRFTTSGDAFYVPTGDTPSVNGLNLLINGQNAGIVMGDQTYTADGGAQVNVAGTDQTYTNSAISGDGMVTITGGYKFILKGSSLSPIATHATPATDGQFLINGNLQFAKSATGADSVLTTVVTATGGAVGSYSQLSVTGAVSSASSTKNALADADLVVDISQGLHLTSETLTILANSGLVGSSFDKVTIVGGPGQVSYTSNGVVLTFHIPGDINGDGLVDVADYNVWAANVGKTGATWAQGDLNGDGLVDVADYNIWAANVGKTAATPEPLTLSLLALGGLAMLRRRK